MKEITLEKLSTCPLCNSPEIELLFTAQDTLHQMPGNWGVNSCKQCRFMFTSPRPDKKHIGHFYPEDYSPFISFTPNQQTAKWKQLGKNLFNILLDPKEEVIPEMEAGSLLEVGCATGRTLGNFHQKGWSVYGLEPATRAVEQLQKLKFASVKQGTIEDVFFDNNSFNLVLAFMVLEHLHNPLSDLKKVLAWLKPGGYISGSVPNCGSWEFNAFGAEWFALQVPTHLSHFTPETIKQALFKAGFINIKIYQQRNLYNLTVQLGRFLNRKKLPLSDFFITFPEQAPWWARVICRLLATPVAWAGQSGRISFTAEKSH